MEFDGPPPICPSCTHAHHPVRPLVPPFLLPASSLPPRVCYPKSVTGEVYTLPCGLCGQCNATTSCLCMSWIRCLAHPPPLPFSLNPPLSIYPDAKVSGVWASGQGQNLPARRKDDGPLLRNAAFRKIRPTTRSPGLQKLVGSSEDSPQSSLCRRRGDCP